MERKNFQIIAYIIVGFLLINLFMFLFLHVGGKSANEALTLTPEKKQLNITVYYVHNDNLVGENKIITPESDNELEAILEAYLLPSRDPLNNTNLRYLQFESIERILGTIYIYVSKETFHDRRIYNENMELYVMSLVNTLTEYYPKDRVQILVDNEDLSKPIHGLSLDRSFSRDERTILLKEREVAAYTELFINEILLGQMEEAYSSLSLSMKMSFSDFVVFGESYREKHKKNPPYSYQVFDSDTGYLVKIYYKDGSTDLWSLLRRDGELFIEFNPLAYL